VAGGWRKLHNEVLQNLYSSPVIVAVGVIKSRRIRWVGHVTRMSKKGEKCIQNFCQKSRREETSWKT
jgi:hypothetical protein